MNEYDFLIAIAQISLAFAGISSIVSVFRSMNERWADLDLTGMKLILEHNFALYVDRSLFSRSPILIQGLASVVLFQSPAFAFLDLRSIYQRTTT